jgi:23S rRNA (cytidine1920-2'-O)/16S rRNA (cytidine1409-2'-O)-methyltransferase
VFIFAGAALTKISAGAEFSVFFCAVSVDEVVFSAAACGFSDATGAVRALAVALLALGLRAAANAAMAGLTGFSVAVLDAVLDILLVEKGLAETRSKAKQMIEGGLVTAECGGLLTKPSQNVPVDIVLKLAETQQYVSRAALKLVGALDHWQIDPKGMVCLDVGASTGGFTEVLLKRHAAKVYAVDVGHAQLHPRLTNHPQIILMEKTNSKDLNRELIPEPIDLIVCDVSFISLTKALPAALKLGKKLVALIKPQFEVGRENLSKGIVKDESIYPALCTNISKWLSDEGWKVIGITDSPILGKEGNKEFLIYATK